MDFFGRLFFLVGCCTGFFFLGSSSGHFGMVPLTGMICAYVGVTAHVCDNDDLYIMGVDFFSCMMIDVDDVVVKVGAIDDCDE